jgi:dTDP-4-dehydrorhamnose reductase
MNKSILVLGSAGMAGHVIYKVLKEELKDFRIFDVARDSRFVNPSKCMDIKDFKMLEHYIEELKPAFIINCIGLLNKSAENFPDEAILINSYLPHFLESKTKNSSTKVIHISTDCVFSGSKGMYKEDDFRDATGYYALTKALGELNNNKDLTIRTSIIGPE